MEPWKRGTVFKILDELWICISKRVSKMQILFLFAHKLCLSSYFLLAAICLWPAVCWCVLITILEMLGRRRPHGFRPSRQIMMQPDNMHFNIQIFFGGQMEERFNGKMVLRRASSACQWLTHILGTELTDFKFLTWLQFVRQSFPINRIPMIQRGRAKLTLNARLVALYRSIWQMHKCKCLEKTLMVTV